VSHTGSFLTRPNRSVPASSPHIFYLTLSFPKEISAEVVVLREAAKKERQEWINNVPPVILKELNRRRAEKGKIVLRKHLEREKRPLTPFFRSVSLPPWRAYHPSMMVIYRYLKEFQKTQSMSDTGVIAVAKEAGQNWRQMSEVEKEVRGSFLH